MSSDPMSSDKLEQHHGLQLSALMDGELAPDQARFLLRRLQHDGELADSWERWQLAGEVLRGRVGLLLPDGFAERIGAAVRMEPKPATSRRAPGILRWGGVAALAASVAVVALMLPRQVPDAQVQGATESIAATPDTGRRDAVEAPAVEPRSIAPVVAGPQAAAPMRAVASRATPSRAADRGHASSRIEAPVAARATVPSERIADAVAATPASEPALPDQVARDPFSDASLASRPWPRAVLPQVGSGGTLAAGLTAGGSRSPSFYPFEPRLPAQAEQPAPEVPQQAPN